MRIDGAVGATERLNRRRDQAVDTEGVDLGQTGSDRNWDGYTAEFLNAQRYVEKRHYRQRLDLMHYERQRQEIMKDLGADPYVD